MSLQVIQKQVGILSTNCYIVFREGAKKCLLVDPGGGEKELQLEMKSRGVSPEAILLTHSHGDHIMAVSPLKKEFPDIEIACHEECSMRMVDPRRNLSLLFGLPFAAPPATRLLKDNDIYENSGVKLKCLFCPGHSPGSLVFLAEEDGVCFSGDVLFNSGVGRTDFPEGDSALLMKSIREKLFVLPDDTIVYSGHGPQTKIGVEKRGNPFF
jgi:hydroxyacylglutathione hydrolase